VFTGRADWYVLEGLPQNYHLMASDVRVLIDREYKSLPDSEWREKIIYYKQAQNQFDADHMQEGETYCKAFWEKKRTNERQEADLQEEVLAKIDNNQQEEAREYYQKNSLRLKFQEKLFRQNQSYMDALIHTRQHIDNWIKTTLGSSKENRQKDTGRSGKTEDNSKNHPLTIVPGAREVLNKSLRKYIEKEEHQALEDLICKGEIPITKITISCTVNQFADAFIKAEAVPVSGASKLSREIPKFFQRKSLEEFGISYLERKLRKGKESK